MICRAHSHRGTRKTAGPLVPPRGELGSARVQDPPQPGLGCGGDDGCGQLSQPEASVDNAAVLACIIQGSPRSWSWRESPHPEGTHRPRALGRSARCGSRRGGNGRYFVQRSRRAGELSWPGPLPAPAGKSTAACEPQARPRYRPVPANAMSRKQSRELASVRCTRPGSWLADPRGAPEEGTRCASHATGRHHDDDEVETVLVAADSVS